MDFDTYGCKSFIDIQPTNGQFSFELCAFKFKTNKKTCNYGNNRGAVLLLKR